MGPPGWSEHAETVVDNLENRLPQYSREEIRFELAISNYHGGACERRLSNRSPTTSQSLDDQVPEYAEAVLENLAARFPEYDRKSIAAELVAANYHGGQAISRLNEKASRAGKP